MKNFLVFLLIISLDLFAQTPDGNFILKKVDENIGSDNKISISKMHINGRRGSRTIESKSWIQGMERSFTEYLSPPREKGTKMLKLGDQLWTYTPETDRTILISGHMLRQSVMGSDLSYEDLMEDTRLSNIYKSDVVAEEDYQNRPCWVLQLTAKNVDVAYHTRKIWVDKERYVVLQENRYAKSGKLLKNTEVKRVEKNSNRWVPMEVVFKDMLKSGDGTQFIVESIQFNAEIPEYIFSKAALKK